MLTSLLVFKGGRVHPDFFVAKLDFEIAIIYTRACDQTFEDFLTFKICDQAGAQSFKHYSTYLYRITSSLAYG